MRAGTLKDMLRSNSSKIPFIYNQAIAVCENFQYLIGKEFDYDYKEISNIADIIIAPHNKSELQDFMHDYQKDKKTRMPKNENSFYNVLIIAYVLPDKEIVVYKDILSYTNKYRVDFNPDNYF